MPAKRFLLCPVLCAVMFLSLATAESAYVLEYDVFTDLTSFAQASGMTTVYDFEDVPVGTNCKTYDFGDFIVNGSSLYRVDIENENTHELHFNTSSYDQDMAVAFHDPTIAFGFDWRNTDNNDDMIRVDFEDTRYVLGAKGESGFWGVVATKGLISSDTPFLFGDTPGGAGWTEGNLDNFRYAGAPEPTALTLLALAGLVVLNRRRHTA